MTSNQNLRRRAPLLLLLAASCLCIASACVGNAVRQTTTLPAMRAAWEAIKVEAAREASLTADADGQAAVAAADAAMAAGTAAAVAAAPWPRVHQLAEADIQRRVTAAQIGPGVADSLREELRLFAEARSVFTRSAAP